MFYDPIPIEGEGTVSMARTSDGRLQDDLDGGCADETLQFSWGSKEYLIDLSSTHARQLRQALCAPSDEALRVYAVAGRRVAPRVIRGHRSGRP